jgi:uncharacterized protein YlxW (UPF0749 family)
MNILLIILVIVLISIVVITKMNFKQCNDIKQSLTNENSALMKRIDIVSAKVNTLTKANTELAEVITMKNKTIKSYDDSNKLRNEELVNRIIFLTEEANIAENVKIKTTVDDLGVTSIHPTIRRKVAGKWTEVPVNISIK